MVFPLGFNSMGIDNIPAVASESAPMGEMIFPPKGAGMDPFGLHGPKVSGVSDPALMNLSGTRFGPAGPSMNSMIFPAPGFPSSYGPPPMPPYGMPQAPSGQGGGNIAQFTALLDFIKGIFSGLMFGKMTQQMFPGKI
jgi:hypothetical protein